MDALITGIRLQVARANAGLSQSQAARRANVSENTLKRIELGEVIPSLAVIKKITNAYGLEPSDFYQGVEQ